MKSKVNQSCSPTDNEFLLEQVSSFARLGRWEWDVQQQKFYNSKALLKMFGLSPQKEFENIHAFLKLVVPQDRQLVKDTIHTVMKTKAPIDEEFHILRPDGKILIVKERFGVTLDSSGEVKTLYGYTKDITHQKNVEYALQKTEYGLKQAQNLTYCVNWEIDLHTGKAAWSDSIIKVLGFIPDTVDAFAKRIHPNDMEFVVKAGKDLFEGKPYKIEYRVIRPDGNVRTIYEEAELVTNEAYRPEKMYGTFIDITDRKNREEHMFNSDKLSLLGQLAAGVAHEIRNPLTSLRGFIQIMQSGVMEKDEYYKIMLDELDRIEFIVEEFLRLAKPQESNFSVKDITLIINHVTTLLQSQANMMNVRVIANLPEHLPQVYCDENQIKQVFLNVLKNAMEAMESGGNIVIMIERPVVYKMKITIKDDGPGIPNDILHKIGQPFFTTKKTGTGLGIMICKRIIQNHSGEFDISSQEGEGTTISITLPTTCD